ncbi:MAG: divalent-cation tolerance protein CutA [Candidatus Binatia bacterium]|nr:divalent-cation tolerance protein CutA [Candidatus Binatia bacterium]
MTGYLVVFVTTGGTAEAEQIATTLVNERLAACVNILNPIRSFYRWQGAINDDQECLLLIKARAEDFDALAARVKTLHSYQVPEIIAVPIVAGSDAYIDWLRSETTRREESP